MDIYKFDTQIVKIKESIVNSVITLLLQFEIRIKNC